MNTLVQIYMIQNRFSKPF